MVRSILILVNFFILATALPAQEKENKGKFSGYMFGDYYYMIKNHDSELKDQRGFWFRRIYLTYDYKMDMRFSTRLRLEMSNEGDFSSGIAMVPFVKDAYLQYKVDKQAFLFGISQTPALSTTESIWGYRYLEKVPIDFYRIASSRDFGLAARGDLDKMGEFKYHLMLSNGAGNKQEIDKGKSVLLSVAWMPAEMLTFEFFGEYGDAEGIEDVYTWRIFGAYQAAGFRLGLEYINQTAKESEGPDIKRRLISGFASADLTEQFTLVLRLDKTFDPNPAGEDIAFIPFDPTAKSIFALLGLEWNPVEDVYITPNFEYVTYSKNPAGVNPTDDLLGRLTFFWRFN